MLILISDAFDAALPGRLEKYGAVTDDKNRLSEAEVVLIRSKTKVTKEYIDSASKLRLVIRGGVGLDNVDIPYARSRGIQVFNTADASTIAVAELAFALMIALPNHLTRADRTMREQNWAKKELKRTELKDKTLGILGLGRIGSALALRARAFGMAVISYDPYVHYSDAARMIPDLDEVLAQSDYISMHMPLTDETEGMINKTSLARCKDGVYIINTGRGKCVVEQDVAEALRNGYGNDVWYSDPPDWNSPLLDAPNCILAPHLGASSQENMSRIGDIVDAIIGQYASQEKPL